MAKLPDGEGGDIVYPPAPGAASALSRQGSQLTPVAEAPEARVGGAGDGVEEDSDIMYPEPLFVKNTFVDVQLPQDPSLVGFFQDRQIRSEPPGYGQPESAFGAPAPPGVAPPELPVGAAAHHRTSWASQASAAGAGDFESRCSDWGGGGTPHNNFTSTVTDWGGGTPHNAGPPGGSPFGATHPGMQFYMGPSPFPMGMQGHPGLMPPIPPMMDPRFAGMPGLPGLPLPYPPPGPAPGGANARVLRLVNALPMGGKPAEAAPRPPLQVWSPDQELPSVGSAGHFLGQCKPCAFMAKGCLTGRDCKFCHICDSSEHKKRKKEKTARRKLEQPMNGAVQQW